MKYKYYPSMANESVFRIVLSRQIGDRTQVESAFGGVSITTLKKELMGPKQNKTKPTVNPKD